MLPDAVKTASRFTRHLVVKGWAIGWISLVLVAFSSSGPAQSPSGNVNGEVSGSGKPLPGVHVRLTCDHGAQTSREAVTDAGGHFRFAEVTWGACILDFSATGWQNRRVSIVVRPDSTLYVKTALPAAADELARRSEMVNEDVWLGTNFTNFQMNKLPNGRNIWSLLQSQEPSTVTNRFEIGGTQAAEPALFSAFGSSWTENQYRLNGLDVTDPYQPGLPLINPDFNALAEFQVITASKPAASQASGESLALASPEPPEGLHGGAQMFASGGALQADNMNARLQNFDFPGALRLNSLLDGGLQLGGKLPAKLGALPFFVAFSTQQVSQNLGGFAEPINSGVNRALVDFTAWSDRSQQVNLMYSGQHIFNSARGAMPTVAPEATTLGNDNFNQFQAQWRRSFSPTTLLTASFGVVNAILSSGFQNGAQGISTVDLPLLVFSGPAPLATSGLRTRYEAGAVLQTMLSGPQGSHSLSVGFDWSRSNIVERWYSMGNTEQVLVNGQGSESIRWNTLAQSRQYVQNVAEFVQDVWRPWKWLSVPLGLRIDTSTGRADSANNGISWTTVEPRLGFVVPLRLPGLVLHGSWSRYGHLLQGRYLDFGNPNALGGEVYARQAPSGTGAASPQQLGPLLRRFGGPYSAVDPNLARPYTDEYSFGVQENLGNRLTAYVRFVRRDDHRLIAVENTGVPFSDYTAVQYTDPGSDGIFGTADDQVLTLYNEKPSALGSDFLLLTNPSLRAMYKGVQFLLTARVRQSWEFSVNFTAGESSARTAPGNNPFQSDTGFVGTLAVDPNTLVMSQGRTYFDRGYMGKITGYYAAPRRFYLAAVATYFDGTPFARLLFVNGFNQGPFFVKATPVGHPGGFQTELNASIDVRVARDFHLARGAITGYLDVFNLMNWNSNTQESDLTGPAFILRVPLAVEAPRTVRLGVAWHF